MTRLDRIEADLEIIKEILLTTASRTESTDKRIDNLTLSLQKQNRLADERGRKIDTIELEYSSREFA